MHCTGAGLLVKVVLLCIMLCLADLWNVITLGINCFWRLSGCQHGRLQAFFYTLLVALCRVGLVLFGHVLHEHHGVHTAMAVKSPEGLRYHLHCLGAKGIG